MATEARTTGTPATGRSSLGAPLLVGAACASGLAILMPPVLVLGFGLLAVALLRRRVDAFAMFAVGFALVAVAYAVLAVINAATAGASSGSDQSPPPQ